MEKKTDKELLQDIVAIYFKSSSTIELDKTLKEYIKNNKLTKTKTYLRKLLDEYKKKSLKGTLEYEMIRNTQEIHKIESSYKTMVEKLIPMSDEELLKYINENGINRIRVKLENYIKNVKEENKAELARQTLERINSLYESKKVSSQSKYEEQKYNDAISVFETMVKRGFFNYTDFKTKMNKYFGCDSVEMDKLLTNSRTLLRTKYPEKFQEYKNKMEKNKIRFYIMHEQQFKNMIIGIRHEQYDIVDFYINFNLSSKAFENLYYDLTEKNIIAPDDKITLNKFFEKYNERMREAYYTDNHGKPIECNGQISQEDEEKIKEFMEQYGIPEKYFKLCYSKYKKGELKNYFGIQLKKISY